MELLHTNPQEARLAKAYKTFFLCGSPKLVVILTQVALWFSILNAFAVVFNNDASWPLVVTAIVLALLNGAYIIVGMTPALAGLLYNGPKLNVQFVKEVLKRHPQADKIMLYRNYAAAKASAKVRVENNE